MPVHGDTLMQATIDDLRDRRDLAAALLDRRALATYLGVSVRTLDRLDATGRLPQALRLGVGRSLKRWRRGEVDGWIGSGCPSRTEARKGGAP